MRKFLVVFGVTLLSGCGLTPIENLEESPRIPLPRVMADHPPSERPEEGWTSVTTSSLPWIFEDGTDLAEANGGGSLVAGGPYRNDGTANRNFGLLKIGTDGQPDPSFGSGGLAISFTEWRSGLALDVLVIGDAEIVCGRVYDDANSAFALARLDLLGRPEGQQPGQGAPGETVIRESSACRALAADPNDSFVAGGETAGNHSLWRFKSDGSLDLAFGNAGQSVVPRMVEGSCCVRDISIGDDGSIFVSTSPGGYVFKLTPDGTHDLSFGTEGYLVVSGAAESVQLDGDRLVIAGFHRSGYKPFIERYFLDGSVDETFGDGGIITIDRFGELTDTDADGDGLIAVGRTDVGGLLLRIDASGQIDPAVGVKHFPLDNATEFNAVEVFSDGNIVISGYDPLLFRILREPSIADPPE